MPTAHSSTTRSQAQLRGLAKAVLLVCCIGLLNTNAFAATGHRRTAIVRAVESARPAVVNIRGVKTRSNGSQYAPEPDKRVNGMGTGVIVDPRGYILTNHHVVEGVSRINVTLLDGRIFQGRLVARDSQTDLALVHIPTRKSLPVIKIGTSEDLMLAETVIAIGNAFGYENTITQGIISSLHRSVQVSDTQYYHDLIQTDASINPGNSGGPLINIDGDMVGINVATRVGAQGIGFAIPVDRVMEITAKLLTTERLSGTWHGVIPGRSPRGVIASVIESDSPAASANLRSGDLITNINGMPIKRPIDVERAMLDLQPGDEAQVRVQRKGENISLAMKLTKAPARRQSDEAKAWETLGLRITPVSASKVRAHNARLNGGLRIVSVRDGGPAAQQGVRPGDILVGIHGWETISMDNLSYIMNHADFGSKKTVRFFILRDDKELYGQLSTAWLR